MYFFLADALSKAKTDQFDKNESVSSEKNKEPLVVDNILHAEGNEDDKIDFSKLENFLHPNSGSLRQIIEDRVIKHPKILSEMLSVNFNDLVAVFQDLFHQQKSKHKTIEEIYVEFLNLVEQEGSEGIQRYAASLRNDQNR